jgi:hypothetical protein
MMVMLNFFRALYDSEAIMIIRFKLKARRGGDLLIKG